MSQFAFGSGKVWITPLTDAYGNAIATPTPFQLITLQEVNVDISYDTKELYGANAFPDDIARGKGKLSVKAKAAHVSVKQLDAFLTAQGITAGQTGVVDDVTGTAVPATPYQITVTPPATGVYAGDLGVVNKATGLPLTRVTGTPTTGQYAVTAAGQYTFAAADTGVVMLIDYRYTLTTGNAVDLINLPMGEIPQFIVDFALTKNGKRTYLRFYRAVAAKLGLASKQDDYTIPDFEFMGFADPITGKTHYMSTLE